MPTLSPESIEQALATQQRRRAGASARSWSRCAPSPRRTCCRRWARSSASPYSAELKADDVDADLATRSRSASPSSTACCRSSARATRAMVATADPLDDGRARRSAHAARRRGAAGAGAVAARSSRSSTTSTAARHDKGGDLGEKGDEEDEGGERGAGRHPRAHRRGADHPLGQLAAVPRGQGARERYPHRAGREGGHRPLPHRRRAATRSQRAPRAVHAVDHLAREDHGRPEHRREAAAAGRPHPPQDRRQGHRHARRDRARRSKRASASRSVCSIASRCCSTWPTSASATITCGRSDELIHRPHGIMLVTGPTGSGKTTTLYACLAKINTPDLNILTVEDPVEYQLDGISQTAGQREDRPDVRGGAALVPAPRPGRHHGRRDPRPRDRGDRDPGVAHRPPGALDHPHQRRRRRDHAAGRHGRRAVPGGVVADGAAGAAAGAARVPASAASPTSPTTRTCASIGIDPGGVRARRGAARAVQGRRGVRAAARDAVPRAARAAARSAWAPATRAGPRSTSC